MSDSAAVPARPMLLALSHLRWDFVFQRPQQLLSRAARDYRVVYIEEPVREASVEPRVVAGFRGDGVELVQPHVPDSYDDAQTSAFQKEVVDTYAKAADGLTLWFYTPMALRFTRHVAADVIVFDKMDELSAFKNAPPELLALEQELLDLADVVFTGGASMHEAANDRHENIHCFPSSIDAPHFAAARGGLLDPGDQQALAHPRIGFFGVIDERFDIALLADVAARRRDWQFVMLGPVVKIDPATLPQGPNLHWLGSKDYRQLPEYLAHWDIGWMPFAINDATRFISPTKTPEFLAAGLPVVSTAIRDVVRPYGEAGLVTIATNAEQTVDAIAVLLAARPAGWLERVADQLARSSWDSTWDAMNRLLHDTVVFPGAPMLDRATTPTKEYSNV